MRAERPDRRQRAERGSALLLIPAAFVALLVLGAIAVDQSMVFASRRELIDVAASAANDAAAVALDQSAYRGSAAPTMSLARAEAAVGEALAARGRDDVVASVRIDDADDGPRVVVRLEVELRSVFARLAPGGYRRTAIRVEASSTLVAS